LKDWAALLTAIASVAWPAVTIAALLLFKRDIRSLIGRVKRGKLLGQELELSENVQELEEVATAARAQLPAIEADGQNSQEDDQASNQGSEGGQVDRRKERIFEEAVSSPKAGLILLSAEIEGAGRRLLASLGLLKGRRTIPLPEIIRTLRSSELVPATLVRSVETFLQVRNKIVHGRAASHDDILSALDSGLIILDALQAVPHAIHVVAHAGLELYADGAGTQVIPGGKAMILEAKKSTGEPAGTNVVPTTRADYRLGQRVAWEWNPAKVFSEAWYRDPESGKIKHGWSQAMEFSGRPLDEV
jgi:hypothetical protein